MIQVVSSYVISRCPDAMLRELPCDGICAHLKLA